MDGMGYILLLYVFFPAPLPGPQKIQRCLCKKIRKIQVLLPFFYEHVPSISFQLLPSRERVHIPAGKRKIIFKYMPYQGDMLISGRVQFLDPIILSWKFGCVLFSCLCREFSITPLRQFGSQQNLGKTLEVPGETPTASLRLEIKRCNPVEVKPVFFRYLSFASNVRFVRLLLGVFLFFDNYTVPWSPSILLSSSLVYLHWLSSLLSLPYMTTPGKLFPKKFGLSLLSQW